MGLAVLMTALATPSAPAQAGQMMVQKLKRAEIWSGAQVLARVRLGTPASVAVQVPVPGEGDKKCEPYRHGAWRATVVSAVAWAGTAGEAPKRLPKPGAGLDLGSVAPTAGAAITIFPANLGMLIRLSTAECVHGSRRSPIVHRFEDGLPPADGAERLVALRWEAGIGWVEAHPGTWFAVGQEAALLREAATARRGLGERVQPESPTVDPALCIDATECVAGQAFHCSACGPCPGPATTAHHAEALRRASAACHRTHHPVTSAQPAPKPKGGNTPAAPISQAPQCAPCPSPPPSRPPPPVVCEAMACVFASPRRAP